MKKRAHNSAALSYRLSSSAICLVSGGLRHAAVVVPENRRAQTGLSELVSWYRRERLSVSNQTARMRNLCLGNNVTVTTCRGRWRAPLAEFHARIQVQPGHEDCLQPCTQDGVCNPRLYHAVRPTQGLCRRGHGTAGPHACPSLRSVPASARMPARANGFGTWWVCCITQLGSASGSEDGQLVERVQNCRAGRSSVRLLQREDGPWQAWKAH